MSTTLRDFIANREGEIKDQLKALRAELKELQIAKAALGDQDSAPPRTLATVPTIKDMARSALREAPEGLTSHEILAAIKQQFNRDIDRTSLSPQLSRLKGDGEVQLMGEKWFWSHHYDQKLRAIEATLGGGNIIVEQETEEEEDDGYPPF